MNGRIGAERGSSASYGLLSFSRSIRSALLVAGGVATCAGAVQAQDRAPGPTLEDLIPDIAVEDPEAWAADGSDPVPEPEPPTGQETVQNVDDAVELATDIPLEITTELPEADSPMAELPGLAIEWPDDLELPPFEPLTPDNSAQMADFDPSLMDALPDSEVTEIDSQLVLAVPDDAGGFPQRSEFVERFAQLSTIEELEDSEANVAQMAARARADEELLNQLLRVYGYYDALVIRSIGGVAPGDEQAEGDAVVRFDIVPGPRYSFGEIDLGGLSTAPDAAALRSGFDIQTGDPLSSDRIVEEQYKLDEALGESGYPFAEIAAPTLLIDHSDNTGDLSMNVQPKGKYVFAGVNSSEPEFLSSRHLERIARFDPGDVYKRSLEFDLRRAITATGLVSSITVTPRELTPPQADAPGEVVMDVEITKAKLRTISGAIGYGSEEGFRVEASWEHRNFFPPEGALKVRAIAGTQEQLAGVSFKRNNFRRRDQVLLFDAYASSVDNNAYEATTIALQGSIERLSNLLFQKPFSWAAGFEILASDERNRVVNNEVRPRQRYFIGSVFGRATIDTTDSLLDPSRGYRLTGFVAPEVSRTNGTEFTYVRAQGDASLYRKVSDRVVMAARLRLATIEGAELEGIAPSRRLYAGGGSSVRGYGYRSIGPRDASGQPTGGRSLVELSAEARVQTGFFDGALSVVPFVDAGSVASGSTPDFASIKFGAGVGIRYETGFGPIRVDAGVPLNRDPEYDSPVAVYVSLGQAF